MKVMGKREVGQLSIFDMAVFFIISDLFSLSIDGNWDVLFKSLLVAVIMSILQIVTSLLILKFEKTRNVVEHIPTIIIKDGKINQETMAKQRYNIDDLMSQLRVKGLTKLDDIKLAVLEANGELSVLKKDETECFPFPLIKDGKIDYRALNESGLSQNWLINNLNDKKIENVFMAMLEKENLIIIDKISIDIKKTHKNMDDYSN